MKAHGRILVALALVAACGDADGSTPPDAAPVADADADAALLTDFWFVMDSVQVPETVDDAIMLALDLDGNDAPDNALGALLAALHGQADMPVAAAQMQAIVSGRALTLVSLADVDLDGGGSVPVQVVPGEDLDDDPGDNFSGTEPFALAPVEGADGELPGTLEDGLLRAGPGALPVLLAVGGDPANVVALRGVGGRIESLASGLVLAEGRLGVAVTDEEVDARLIPAMASGMDLIVQRDCPDAVCQPGSPGEQLAAFFDDDEDGRITADELRANSLISSTIGNPDLDLLDADGDYNPGVDGVKDSLSLGLGFTAVRATLAE